MSFALINCEESAEQFLRSCSYFHDALLREVHALSNSYVDANLSMWEAYPHMDVRLIFQQQAKDTTVIDVICREVRDLSVRETIVSSAEIDVKPDSITLEFDSGSHVICQLMEYRFFGADRLTDQSLTCNTIPPETVIVLKKIVNDTVTCGACGATWQWPDRPDARCPRCRRLHQVDF